MAPSAEVEYLGLVRAEMRDHRAYFRRQLWHHRVLRLVVIISAGSVPVLASVADVPRWVLGILGAGAAAAEAVQQLFQFRRTSNIAMDVANQLERELNRYVMRVRPYAGTDVQASDSLFVERVEDIRADADRRFLDTWRSVPAAGDEGKGSASA